MWKDCKKWETKMHHFDLKSYRLEKLPIQFTSSIQLVQFTNSVEYV